MTRFKSYMFSAEGEIVRLAMYHNGNNASRAARWLGMTYKSFLQKRRAHGLEVKPRASFSVLDKKRLQGRYRGSVTEEEDRLFGAYVRIEAEKKEIEKRLIELEKKNA